MRHLFVALVLTSAFACTTVQQRNTEKTLAAALISDQQETQLGLQVHEQLKSQNTRFTENAKVGVYVETLAHKLTQFSDQDRKIDWVIFVIDDLKTVNAFATPGGRIYVYTGLLAAADNEAEVIGVMGHEMGHVVARHSARQLIGQYGLEAVTKMALGEKSTEVAQLAAGLAGKGAMLAYGRGMETEADEYGARYSSLAGYDPHGIATFFQKLEAKSGKQPELLTWFSTHPSNPERIAHVNDYVTQNNLTGANLGGDALKEIKKELGVK